MRTEECHDNISLAEGRRLIALMWSEYHISLFFFITLDTLGLYTTQCPARFILSWLSLYHILLSTLQFTEFLRRSKSNCSKRCLEINLMFTWYLAGHLLSLTARNARSQSPGQHQVVITTNITPQLFVSYQDKETHQTSLTFRILEEVLVNLLFHCYQPGVTATVITEIAVFIQCRLFPLSRQSL